MIFTGKDGSIYEIPKERYAEFEVSAQRAKEILDMAKSMNKSSSNNNEVSGYADYSMLFPQPDPIVLDPASAARAQAYGAAVSYSIMTVANTINNLSK